MPGKWSTAHGPRMVWLEEAMVESGGVRCADTSYRPAKIGRQEPAVPWVVMGTGLSGTRALAAARYARASAAHGSAPLTFDDGHFDNSDTAPRQLVHLRRGEVCRYPIGHFDVEPSPAADLPILDQVACRYHHLGGGAAAASPQRRTCGPDR